MTGEQLHPTNGRLVEIELVYDDQVLMRHQVNTTVTWSSDHCEISPILAADKELFSKSDALVNLYLEPIDATNNGQKILIQQQRISVQVGADYQPKGSGFLLVINANTSTSAIKHWVEKLSKLSNGAPIDIWNTSLYGTLPLDTTYQDSPSLLSHTKGGTVVILDNEYGLKKQHDSSVLTPKLQLKAAEEYKTSIVVVGSSKQLPNDELSSTHLLLSGDDTVPVLDSYDTLFQYLLQKYDSNPIIDGIQTAQLPYYKVEVPLTEHFLCFSSVIDPLIEAQRLREKLQSIFPTRSYLVEVDVNQKNASSAIIGVREILHVADSKMTQIVKPDQELTNEGYIEDSKETDQLVGALPFRQKLQQLFSETKNPYHQQLIQTMLQDLLQEQALVSCSETYGTWFQILKRTYQHDFTKELNKLHELVTMIDKLSLDAAQKFAPLVVRLMAHVAYHAEQQSSFWTKLAHFFCPQTAELVRCSSLDLAKKAMYQVMPQVGFEQGIAKEVQRVALKEEIKQIILDNKNPPFFSFFRKALNMTQLKALQSLSNTIDLCDEHDEWTKTLPIFDEQLMKQHAELHSVYEQFKSLYSSTKIGVQPLP